MKKKAKTKRRSLFDREMAKSSFRSKYRTEKKAFEVEVQILRAIEQNGITMMDLADISGMQLSNVSRDLSQKKIRRATLPKIAKYADALDRDFVPLLLPRTRTERRKVLSRLQRAFG